MKTDAQRARDARKRLKLRDHNRGIAPNTWELSISTYIWDGWHNGCFDGRKCWEDQDVSSMWGYKTCEENMVQFHFRSVHSGWLVNSGHEVSTHVMSCLEAHGESVRHHKAWLQNRKGDCKISFGWDAAQQRKYEITSQSGDTFLRTELLVRKNGQIGGHVWQGMVDLQIGAADVAAVAYSLKSQLTPALL